MQTIPSNIARAVEAAVPSFTKIVNDERSDKIVITLDAFADEPDLLHQCLWYAISRGKRVLVVDEREIPHIHEQAIDLTGRP